MAQTRFLAASWNPEPVWSDPLLRARGQIDTAGFAHATFVEPDHNFLDGQPDSAKAAPPMADYGVRALGNDIAVPAGAIPALRWLGLGNRVDLEGMFLNAGHYIAPGHDSVGARPYVTRPEQ